MLFYLHIRTHKSRSREKACKITTFFWIDQIFSKEKSKKCIFALFTWHFVQLGSHKLDNFALEVTTFLFPTRPYGGLGLVVRPLRADSFYLPPPCYRVVRPSSIGKYLRWCSWLLITYAALLRPLGRIVFDIFPRKIPLLFAHVIFLLYLCSRKGLTTWYRHSLTLNRRT